MNATIENENKHTAPLPLISIRDIEDAQTRCEKLLKDLKTAEKASETACHAIPRLSRFEDKRETPQWKAWREAVDVEAAIRIELDAQTAYIRGLTHVYLRQVAFVTLWATIETGRPADKAPMWYKAFKKDIAKACEACGIPCEYDDSNGYQTLTVCGASVYVHSDGHYLKFWAAGGKYEMYAGDYQYGDYNKGYFSPDPRFYPSVPRYTAADVRALTDRYSAECAKAQELKDAYTAALRDIQAPFKAVGLDVEPR